MDHQESELEHQVEIPIVPKELSTYDQRACVAIFVEVAKYIKTNGVTLDDLANGEND